jgi:hypothetical protein
MAIEVRGSAPKPARVKSGAGAIDTALVYPKRELMKLMGWAEPAWSSAISQGLVAHKAGRRIWVEGSEVVRYLRSRSNRGEEVANG